MTDIATTGAIVRFEGENDFLSNFYYGKFNWRGHEFTTGEHAFQAAKAYHSKDEFLSEFMAYFEKVRTAEPPAKAKYHGRSVKLNVAEWDAQKVWYMREIVHAKFAQVPGLAGRLINTGVQMLVEGNDWGDKFWGRVNENGKWTGLNTLGVILMEERGFWLHGRSGDA